MEAVILAGGYGTRLSEETAFRPKAMVKVGSRPIIWHIMTIFAQYEITDFIICAGYRSDQIKEYFANYSLHNSDVIFDLRAGTVDIRKDEVEPWHVTVVDTGGSTMTGGRLRRIRKYLKGDTFLATYGDGLADININALIDFHHEHGLAATLTAVRRSERYGVLQLDETQTRIECFREKPSNGHSDTWINGGFFVLEHSVFDYIDSDASVLEREPLERLANEGKLAAYRHDGFWYGMDTLNDKIVLDQLWRSGRAPWKCP